MPVDYAIEMTVRYPDLPRHMNLGDTSLLEIPPDDFTDRNGLICLKSLLHLYWIDCKDNKTFSLNQFQRMIVHPQFFCSSADGGHRAGVEAAGEEGEAVGRGCGGETEAWREIFFIGRSSEGYAVVDVIPCQYSVGLVLQGIMQYFLYMKHPSFSIASDEGEGLVAGWHG